MAKAALRRKAEDEMELPPIDLSRTVPKKAGGENNFYTTDGELTLEDAKKQLASMARRQGAKVQGEVVGVLAGAIVGLPDGEQQKAINNIGAKNAFSLIAKAAGEKDDSALLALSNGKIAAAFVKDPLAIARSLKGLAKAAGESSYNAFDALTDDSLASAFLKDPQKITNAIRGIVAAVPDIDALNELARGSVPHLFAKYPEEFVQLAALAGGNAVGAFYALSNAKMAELFDKDPSAMVKLFGEISTSALKGALPLLNSLANDSLAGAFADGPQAIARVLIGIAITADKSAGSAYPAFEFLSNDAVARAFAKDPQGVARALNGISAAAGESADRVFDTLAEEKMTALFLGHMGEFVQMAKAAGRSSNWLFLALADEDISALFAKYPEEFVQIANGAGRNADSAFKALIYTDVQPLFMKYPGEFAKLAAAAGEASGNAFTAISTPALAGAFAADPQKIIGAFGKIAKAADTGAGDAFEAISYAAPLFLKYPDEFVQIAQAAGYHATMAYSALSDPELASIFDKSMAPLFTMMAKATGEYVGSAFIALRNARIARSFAKDPQALSGEFGGIIKAAGRFSPDAFKALLIDDVAETFISDPPATAKAFEDVMKMSGAFASSAFTAISQYGAAGQFAKFARKEMGMGQFSVSLFSSDAVAIELGRPLDDLHTQAIKRKDYLNGLSPEQVAGLLLSDPVFFFTSTNHMLFDRLSAICKEKNTTVTGLLKSYGIGIDSSQGRNIIFRAISYDRLYGAQTSGIFTKEEINEVIPALLDPLKKDWFDQTYFYMLANSLDGISKAGHKQALLGALKGQAGKGDEEKSKATAFLVDYLEHPEHFNDREFNRKNYLDASGRLLIVQVFDKHDTESDHWKLTQEWASKYGQPVQGSSGELIYENASAKIVLFMGKDESENQSFIKSTLEKNKDVILTFRGHSYSLEKNFPADIFGNHGGHVLFIPGSCGSASSIPSYISSNPLTKFAFFANSSTGRGQVTNYGILDGLIAAKTPATFRKILDSKRAIIEANDGNAATIQTPDLLGERLMEHIYSER